MKPEFLSKQQASEIYEVLLLNDFEQTASLSDEYQLLRDRLLSRTKTIDYEIITLKNKKNAKYLYDLKFGLAIYEETNKIFNLTNNIGTASNEKFWIYINVIVIPDIVNQRWKSINDSKVRFYNQTNRIYTYTLWWYIYTSWQGNSNNTYEVLKGFTTDTIVQLVERSGGGYNRFLNIEIVRKLSEQTDFNDDLFRKVMKLNTIYNKTIHPEFYDGGIKGFVEMIFKNI